MKGSGQFLQILYIHRVFLSHELTNITNNKIIFIEQCSSKGFVFY